MSAPPPPDPFDRLLERWAGEQPKPSGSVAPEVWRRIATAERTAANPPPTWLERVNAAFARPSFAAAFIAACMLLGLFLAEVRTSRQEARYGAQLAQDYLRLVDPLLSEKGPAPRAQP